MDLIKKMFRLSNLGTMIFCILNLGLIIAVFTNGFTDFSYIEWIMMGYACGVLISLSPIGEFILVVLAGGRKIKRQDMKIRIIPLLEIVYNKAKKEEPKMVNSIKLKVVYDDAPNAYAIGRRTICITSGLFQLSDDEIMGVLAHEIGHLANRHTELQLLIGGSNLFISIILIALKVVSWIIIGVCTILAISTRSRVASIIISITGMITAAFIWLWTKFCMLFVKISMRQNEYEADEFAYKIGYGVQLAKALDKICVDVASENGFLKALNSTHPNHNDRIARLQYLGVDYYAY